MIHWRSLSCCALSKNIDWSIVSSYVTSVIKCEIYGDVWGQQQLAETQKFAGNVFEVKTYLKHVAHKGEDFLTVTAWYSPLYPSWTPDPDDGSTKLLWNIANYLPFERAQQHRHLELHQHCCENQRPRRVGVQCIIEEPYHSVGNHLSDQPHYPEYHKLSLHHHETLKFHIDFPCHTSRSRLLKFLCIFFHFHHL